jgi:hypothetical protein
MRNPDVKPLLERKPSPIDGAEPVGRRRFKIKPTGRNRPAGGGFGRLEGYFSFL